MRDLCGAGRCPAVMAPGPGRESVVKPIKWLKDQWEDHVQPHVTAPRVAAGCEVFLVLAWIYEKCPWF